MGCLVAVGHNMWSNFASPYSDCRETSHGAYSMLGECILLQEANIRVAFANLEIYSCTYGLSRCTRPQHVIKLCFSILWLPQNLPRCLLYVMRVQLATRSQHSCGFRKYRVLFLHLWAVWLQSATICDETLLLHTLVAAKPPTVLTLC